VRQHPLAVLERLWNTDKHRLLAPGFFALAAVKATTPEDIEVHDAKFAGISWRKAPLRLGEVAFTIHLAEQGPGARIEWHGELHPTVCFDDGQRVYETLDEAVRFAEGLVARFAR